MADKSVSVEVKVDTNNGVNAIQQLKKEIKELESLSLKAYESGNEALGRKYAEAVGSAKDKLSDFKSEIASVQDAGSKLGSLAKVGATIAQGFAGAVASASLFGASGENVEKVLLKVQSATALAQTAQALANSTEDIAIAKKIIFSKVTTIATSVVTFFGTASATAMALATGGITIVVGLVIALVYQLSLANDEEEKNIALEKQRNAEVEKNKQARSESNKELQKEFELKQSEYKALGKSEAELFELEQTYSALKLQNAKDSQKKLDAINEERKKNNPESKRLNEFNEAEQKEYIALNEEIANLDAQYQIKANERQGEQYQKQQEKAKEQNEKLANIKEDANKKSEELEKLREQQSKDFIARTESEYNTANKLSDQYYSTLITNATIKGEDTKELELKQLQDKLQNAKDYGQDLIAIQNEIALKEKEIADNKLETALKGIEDEKAKKKLALTEGSGGKGVSQAQQLQLDLEFDQKLFDTKLANGDRDIALEQRIADTKIAIGKNVKDANDKIEADKNKQIQDGLQIATQGLQSIQNLTDIFFAGKLSKVKKGSKEEEKILRQQFNSQKKMNIAMATMNGAQAITSILAQYPKFDGGVAMAIALASSITATGLQITKIAATKFDSGGGGGGSTADAGGGGLPNTNSGSSFASPSPIPEQASTLIGGAIKEEPPIRAVVVETDITSSQKRIDRIEKGALFG